MKTPAVRRSLAVGLLCAARLGLADTPAASAQPARAPACDAAAAPLAVRVACGYLAFDGQALWPGFAPATIPLAVYDGKDTWFFGHPHPPASCRADPAWPAACVHPGRHEALVANTSLDLGGVTTATLILSPERPLPVQAAVALHEAFHAFQAKAYPGWRANEAHLFVYPVEDAEALALRRLEDEALRRALRASEPEQTGCWAAAGLAVRRTRFGRLPAAAVGYERGTELKEGLAQYVEDRARGGDPASRWPADGFGAEAVRQRAYASGQTIATLLDRIDPGWRERLDAEGQTPLDVLLERALAPARAKACALSAEDETQSRTAAAEEVAALVERRREALRAFEAQPGAGLEIVAAGEPLWPQGFDPINVQGVAPLQVLHRRYLKLGNASGAVQVLGPASLTRGVGPHPLFAGVSALRVTGLKAAPVVAQEGDAVTIRADGVEGRFSGAAVEREDGLVRVRLAPKAP